MLYNLQLTLEEDIDIVSIPKYSSSIIQKSRSFAMAVSAN